MLKITYYRKHYKMNSMDGFISSYPKKWFINSIECKEQSKNDYIKMLTHFGNSIMKIEKI